MEVMEATRAAREVDLRGSEPFKIVWWIKLGKGCKMSHGFQDYFEIEKSWFEGSFEKKCVKIGFENRK